MHEAGLDDYIVKVFHGMNDVVYAWHVNVWSIGYDDYSPMIGLLCICEVMRLHMYISLVYIDYDLD